MDDTPAERIEASRFPIGSLVEAYDSKDELNRLFGTVTGHQRADDRVKAVEVEFPSFGVRAVPSSNLRFADEGDVQQVAWTTGMFAAQVDSSAPILDVYMEIGRKCKQEDEKLMIKRALVNHIVSMQSRLHAQRSAQPEDGRVRPAAVVAKVMCQLLPLIADVLPRDTSGAAVVPHPHPLVEKRASMLIGFIPGGAAPQPVYRTNKVCDQCNTPITTQCYYSCARGCDFDFCTDCQEELEALFKRTDREHLMWAVEVTSQVAQMPWLLSSTERHELVIILARDWPVSMFERLVRSVVDVANSRVVHLEDSRNIQGDGGFWHAVAMLQLLYRANVLDAAEPRLGEAGVQGPRVPLGAFMLEGIDKCEAVQELERWKTHPEVDLDAMLDGDALELTKEFCIFLTHASLVPVSFRRQCLIWDALSKNISAITDEESELRNQRFSITVRRDPEGLRQDVLKAFDGLATKAMGRPLIATFEGEPASGPGVTTEFFQLAVQAFLETPLWTFDEQHRCYWFSEAKPSVEDQAMLRTCGVLLGQGILRDILVPKVFPKCLYAMLLRDLGSSHCETLGVADLATVAPDLARSLEQLLQYEGEDINDVYGCLEWPERPSGGLTNGNKKDFVQGYVDWYFSGRFSEQHRPFCDGFHAVLGRSELLRRLFDVSQLEAVICGGDIPVDVKAIRSTATEDGWGRDDKHYINDFWEAVEAFDEADRRRFLIFVTASDRMPLKGWGALRLIVQKNGTGDDRLPTSFTCFNTLLLPRYSSKEHLCQGLSQAINNSQGFGLE